MNDETKRVTIAEIAKMTGVSSATVSYVLSGRTDVKVAEQTRERILHLCEQYHYKKGACRERAAGKKQVTIDDIAKEAGVSTATVSYIINDRQDVKISDETRKKVLQICNLRQYAPSPVARLLAGNKNNLNNLIGICFNRSFSPTGRNDAVFSLLCRLQQCLREKNYHTLLLPPVQDDKIAVQENIDGILCIDLSESQFYTLKESYFVPIVAIDMTVQDTLFFKVYDNCSALIACAKEKLHTDRLVFVTGEYNNRPYMNKWKRALADDTLLTVRSAADLAPGIKKCGDAAFLFNSTRLAALALPYIDARRAAAVCTDPQEVPPAPEMARIDLPDNRKAECAVQMLQNAIDRKETEPHTCKLSPLL